MTKKTTPWQPWEYQVLHEGRDDRTTARLLGRSVAEVNRKINLSYDDWYRRNRCPGSPVRPDSILRIARRIYEDDGYWRYLTDGDLEALIQSQTAACFRNFDAAKSPRDITTEEKFVRYFVVCLRRRLIKFREEAARRRRRFVGLSGDIAGPWRSHDGRAWSRLLLRAAVARLPRQARRYIEYRYLEGLEVPEVAAKLRLAVQTVYNKYSLKNVVALVREEVGKLFLKISTGDAAAVVHYLSVEAGFNEAAISDLLCLRRADVDRLLDYPVDWLMGDAARARAVACLGGFR
jgi:hypothetical protein